MFDAGPEEFTGGMNARKYVALTGTSKATATRDLQQLASLGALIPVGGGRSTRYELGGLRAKRSAPRTEIPLQHLSILPRCRDRGLPAGVPL